MIIMRRYGGRKGEGGRLCKEKAAGVGRGGEVGIYKRCHLASLGGKKIPGLCFLFIPPLFPPGAPKS
jgi:hypothetical protein